MVTLKKKVIQLKIYMKFSHVYFQILDQTTKLLIDHIKLVPIYISMRIQGYALEKKVAWSD
jgi:hypothetical protein